MSIGKDNKNQVDSCKRSEYSGINDSTKLGVSNTDEEKSICSIYRQKVVAQDNAGSGSNQATIIMGC